MMRRTKLDRVTHPDDGRHHQIKVEESPEFFACEWTNGVLTIVMRGDRP